MKIRINNWEKYQQRTSGYKRCWWFSLSNKFLEDPEIWELNNAEKIAYLYILCQASQANKDTITISVKHAQRSSDIEPKALKSVIGKLEGFGVLAMICTDPVQEPNSIRPLHNTTVQKQNITTPKGVCPTDLLDAWNLSRGGLAKAKGLSKKRTIACEARLREIPDLSYWIGVIERMAASRFCCGENDRGWKADFDFLLRPDTHLKVIEGKYDNNQKGTGNSALLAKLKGENR